MYSMGSSKNYFAKSIGALLPFLAIAAAVYFIPTILTMFDYEIGQLFYHLRRPVLNDVVRLVTKLGNPLVQTVTTVIVAMFLLFLRRYKVSIWYGVSTALGAYFLNHAVKDFFARPRPTEISHLIAQGGYSFPSGHSMGTMIIYMGILYIILRYSENRWLRGLARFFCPLIIFVVGLTRIYLGVHFVSDVLAGWFLGLTWHYFSVAIFEALIDRPEIIYEDEEYLYYE